MQAARGAALTGAAAGEQSSGSAVPAPPPPPVGGTQRRVGVLVAIAAAVLLADVVTKVLVVATLSDRPPIRLLGGLVLLREERNSGAAFSLAQGATVLFTVVAVGVIVVIVRTAARLRSLSWALVLGLLLGGASGNLADRLFRSPGPLRGAVVDWIDLRVWPVFNVADSAIVIGGLLAVWLSFRGIEIDGRHRAYAGTTPAPGDTPERG